MKSCTSIGVRLEEGLNNCGDEMCDVQWKGGEDVDDEARPSRDSKGLGG